MGVVKTVEVSLTETTGAGVYTASVSVPAGSTLMDVVVHGDALWTAATSATGKVGDATDDDGIFTAIDMKATDLLAGETLSAAGGASTAGGKGGADIAGNQWNRRRLAAARVISLIVTAVGASGNAGRSRLVVAYSSTGSGVVAAGTKV